MRERLLQEPDDSTLEHMVHLATTLERSTQEGPVLGELKSSSRRMRLLDRSRTA